ncbi:MAG: HNH endonuclease [Bacteroidales bacterium]|nr:HNH endonuclease [Bacteroidales bacterium]
MTEWRDIAWWDDYAVNEDGEICRKKDGVIMKQYVQKSGYSAVYLKKNGWVSAVMVHRLVAMAFLPNPDNLPMVDHINTIRSDNRVCNLRYVDAKGNANNETTKKNRRNRKYASH